MSHVLPERSAAEAAIAALRQELERQFAFVAALHHRTQDPSACASWISGCGCMAWQGWLVELDGGVDLDDEYHGRVEANRAWLQ